MKLLDYTIRCFVPSLGIGARWLKEQLEAAGVKVRLTDGCVEELAADAEAAAWIAVSARQVESVSYLSCLRAKIAERAEFVHRWTGSDDKIDMRDETNNILVRIARKYALPRPWKLSEPVASEWQRPPLAWGWRTGAVGAQAQT